MTKESKLSDLPDAVVQKGDELSQMLAEFKQKLDKEDKGDELLIPSVDHAAAKSEELPVSTTLRWFLAAALSTNVLSMKHFPFSSVGPDVFAEEKITVGPLRIIQNKIPELELLGRHEGTGGLNRTTVDETRDQILVIRKHMSLSVSLPSCYLA